MAGITPENLHAEVSFDQPVGREVWPPFDDEDSTSVEQSATNKPK